MVKFAAVEGGGTTWVCAIAENEPSNIIEKKVFKTESDPKLTLEPIRAWLGTKQYDSIGSRCDLNSM